MKKIFLMALILSFAPAVSFAGKTTYIVTNHRLNYVKLKEVKGSVMEGRAMTHPAALDETGLRQALASINLSRSYLISKEVDTLRVFDENAVNFLAPAFAKAFSRAKSNEEIVFSYLAKNPVFIIRNDRLTVGTAWIHENELHIKFSKFYAKVLGDIDKRGNEDKAASSARGLRVKLDLGEGQKYGISDPEEVILDLHYNYAKKPEEVKKSEEEAGVTMAGEKISAGGDVPALTPKERLKQLDQLKKEGLINKEEYDTKRAEIIKEL